jgi:GTP-binding protein LepA
MENLKIKNFCIIAHIDHGKSTLADRFLEITQTVSPDKMRPQYLDMMALERERGITIKMQPVRMVYQGYILNLIDTPGHVDFSYEVSRGLAAVEGAILLVDATKGIQAQTLHHLAQARKQGLKIVPAINKIDSKQAEIESVKKALVDILEKDEVEDILGISAKFGQGVDLLLKKVIEKIPSPSGSIEKPFRALIFDSKYDPYQGVIAFVRVIDGKVKATDDIFLIRKEVVAKVKEVGFFTPEMKKTTELRAGEIGYLATGIKDPTKLRVGETITVLKNGKPAAEALPGYLEPKPMVFISFYPENPNDFERFQKSLQELQLNDPAFEFVTESKSFLGQGFRCGFLGTLHAEIVMERLKREFSLNLVVSQPQVVYQIRRANQKPQLIFAASQMPDNLVNAEVWEQWVRLEIITPQKYLGPVLSFIETIENHYLETKTIGEKLLLIYEAPLREIMNRNFYEKLKSVSQGFASLNYEVIDWRKGDLLKMDILIAGVKEDLLCQIVPRNKINQEARKAVEKLKEVLPRQQFAVALQAKVGGKIIARETLPAIKKDVTAPLYGGDYTRKRKLLEKQKKGKKLLKMTGRVKMTPEIFLKIISES